MTPKRIDIPPQEEVEKHFEAIEDVVMFDARGKKYGTVEKIIK